MSNMEIEVIDIADDDYIEVIDIADDDYIEIIDIADDDDEVEIEDVHNVHCVNNVNIDVNNEENINMDVNMDEQIDVADIVQHHINDENFF